MLKVIIFLMVVGTIITVFLMVVSPGKPKQFMNARGGVLQGSLSEKIYITINGTPQGMFIKSKNINNPVLLFLHGGMPQYFLSEKYPTGLEDIFTVVWWERRGSGMSYNASIDPETITLDQLVADTREITQYLIRRFGQQKIYLMGHSGGTFLGMHMAAQAPELYHAYLGVAQMSNQLKSECMAYDYMLNTYEKQANLKMAGKLKEAPISLSEGISPAYLSLRDIAMHDLGVGTMRNIKSIITGIFIPSILCHDYTLKEKYNTWYGKSLTGVSVLWNTMIDSDLSEEVSNVDIPVYFFHGTYDYTVSYILTRQYFEKLQAPEKEFYTFEHSAHSPMFEEPEKMIQIIKKEILGARG